MTMMRETLTPRHNQSFSPHAISRKNSPSLPNANSSNRGDQGRLRPAVRQISSTEVLSQSASPPTLAGLALLWTHLNAIERKPNCVFTMCMTSFSFVLRPSHPFFVWLHSNSKREVTLIKLPWHHIGTSLVRWSRLLLPRTSEHHHMEKKKGRKVMDPNFSFHGNKSVTQGFLMPTREVLVYQETVEQVWLNLSLGLLKCFFFFFVYGVF